MALFLSRFMSRIFGIAALTIYLAAVPAAAETPPTTEVLVVSGTGTAQQKDTASARDAAIKAGLMTAIDMVMAKQLPDGVMSQNFATLSPFTYSKSDTLVRGYRVLAETSHDNQYRVLVEAAIDVNRLKKELSRLGFATGDAALPAILLMIAQQQGVDTRPCFWWGNPCETEPAAVMALGNALKKKGFTVLEKGLLPDTASPTVATSAAPEIPDAVAVAEAFKAAVVVVGLTSVEPIVAADTVDAYKGVTSVQAFSVPSGEAIATSQQTATSTDANELGSRQKAVIGAAGLAGEDLAKQIVASLEGRQKSTIITVEIHGDRLLLNLIKFRRDLGALPAVDRVQTSEMGSDRATLSVNYKKGARELASTMMQQSFETFQVNIEEITGSIIRLELAPKTKPSADIPPTRMSE